ncbi:MAG: hypothetical protein KBT06_02130 [Prevotellaceae bacterium]|nr:hypothetical protein [Candidatus Colivivens equi]MCQ2077286.1 hypothetical protein [Bacteroidaceae bacterium]
MKRQYIKPDLRIRELSGPICQINLSDLGGQGADNEDADVLDRYYDDDTYSDYDFDF